MTSKKFLNRTLMSLLSLEMSLLWLEMSLLWLELSLLSLELSLLWREPSLLWQEPSLLSPEPSLLSLDIILERDGLLSNGGVAELTCAGELVMTSKKFLNRMLMSLLSPEMSLMLPAMSLLLSDIVFEGGDGTTSELQTPTFGSRDRHSTRFR